MAWDDVLTDEPEVEVEYDGEPLSGDAVLDELQQKAPDTLTAAGLPTLQSFDAVVQASDGKEMSADFVIVTRGKTPNRHGNMVQIAPGPNGKGLITEHYERNPVVLFEHGMGGIPYAVGLSESPRGQVTLKASKSRATARVYFFQQFAFSSEIFLLVDARGLRMASIGFQPRKAMRLRSIGDARGTEERQQDGVIDLTAYYGGLDFTESELFEWSVTVIGADQGALRQALDRRKIGGEKLSRCIPMLQRLVQPTPPVVPGWRPDPPTPNQQAAPGPVAAALPTHQVEGVTISGPPEAIQAFLTRLQAVPAANGVDMAAANGTNATQSAVDQPPRISFEQLGAAFGQAVQAPTQAPDIVAVMTQLPALIGQAVANAAAPIAEAQKQLMERLDTATGKC